MRDLIHHTVEQWAVRQPESIAIIDSGEAVSYDRLNRYANRFGRLFRDTGIPAGGRVVIALENSVMMVAAYLGALKAGATAVPLPAGSRSDRLVPAVIDCTPHACVIDASTAQAVAADSPVARVPHVYVAQSLTRPFDVKPPFRSLSAKLDACPDEDVSVESSDRALAAIIYTSGTTGQPRGVMLTHQNFVANARSIIRYLALTAADRVLCVLPFHYVYGLSLLHTHLLVGGSLVIENRTAFPNVVLEAMRKHETTGFAGVPSTFALMLHRSNLGAIELPHLRYVTQAGGGMPPAQIIEWLQRGPKADFYVMYGATEAAARLTYLPPADLPRKLGSIGRAIPGVEIVVITETGDRAESREIGELVARGENISPGYWKKPEETAERFGPEGYRTGDLGYADEEGYLYLVGRRHDMIKVGANRVGAKEIEDVLHQHPAVFEAAVVGASHPLLGEAPVAFVALRESLADAENALRAFCAAHLAAYKVPARVVKQLEIPKLPGAGKVDRGALRALAAEIRLEAVS